jgi:hypothetical protein
MTMKKMRKVIRRLFRRLMSAPDYRTYDPPYPGDGV